MRLASKNCLRLAALLGVTAVLGACCTKPPLPWPEPERDVPPVLDRDTQGITQHWDQSNLWPRYRYR